MTKTRTAPPPGGFLLPRIARAIREHAGITASEMSRRLGISPSAVSQFEDPETPITEPTLRSYADALGLQLDHAILEALISLRLETVGPVPEPEA